MSRSSSREFVFGYGSLLRPREARGDAAPSILRGFRRGWNVAMDNSKDLPGYKYYVDEATGERPAIFVTFLNIWEDEGARVNGLVLPVGRDTLTALDDRERNYERQDVTGQLDDDFGGRVWAYVGTPAARERYETGRAAGTAVASALYERKVRQDFGTFGPDWLAQFDATTDELGVPLRQLKRIAIPASGRVTDGGRPRARVA
jgi:cation transport regulator ChaC